MYGCFTHKRPCTSKWRQTERLIKRLRKEILREAETVTQSQWQSHIHKAELVTHTHSQRRELMSARREVLMCVRREEAELMSPRGTVPSMATRMADINGRDALHRQPNTRGNPNPNPIPGITVIAL